MTGQTLLDTMEVLNQELQLQTGEADVTRGLLALNVAQDFFESAAARRPNVLGSGTGTVTQTGSTESTAFPTGLKRLDALWYLDPATNRQSWKLEPRRGVGEHSPGTAWFQSLASSSSTGKPIAYFTNGTNIYWDPLPDTTNSVRWYGLQAASDLTAGSTFSYPDDIRLLLAVFAVTLLKIGVGDEITDLSKLAENIFGDTLDTMANFNRDGARPFNYTYDHR